MRTRNTNFLQGVILFSGLFYTVLGIVFYTSPIIFGNIFRMDINEDWIKEIPTDVFISSLYYLARGFSAMLFSAGLSMILPLFDPLRYRGLVYYTGILYPFLSSILLLYHGITLMHGIIIVFGIIFLIILILSTAGMILTQKEARSGVE
jgi:hypothetical protein